MAGPPGPPGIKQAFAIIDEFMCNKKNESEMSERERFCLADRSNILIVQYNINI